MRALVGLGNPGELHRRHRHNAGRMLLDALRRRGRPLERRELDWAELVRLRLPAAGSRDLWLVRPATYMNRSGVAVSEAVEALAVGPGELLVAYDDVDLPLGRLRLRPAGGSGGHRGMASVIEALGTERIPRLRLGIRGAGAPGDTAEYVLRPFDAEEEPVVAAMLRRAADAVEMVLERGLGAAMNAYNPSPSPETPADAPGRGPAFPERGA